MSRPMSERWFVPVMLTWVVLTVAPAIAGVCWGIYLLGNDRVAVGLLSGLGGVVWCVALTWVWCRVIDPVPSDW